jgi:3-dehydroquinate synthase
MKTIEVELVDKSYFILVENGIMGNAAKYVEKILPSNRNKKIFIITEKTVESFGYLDLLSNSLENYQIEKIILPPGEYSKSFTIYEKTANDILSRGITRNDVLIALGGGVIGDLVGFLASTLLRGVPFIQIPTTLLAQVDSSVGGKTAINTDVGKNLVGSFYQPKLVLIDTNTLETLDKRNLKAGYTEAVKYGLICDEAFFSYCEKYGKDCIDKNLEVCEYIIEKSCRYKANIIKQDEFETKDIRVLLNLGHTFAHVYEKMTNYDPNELLHGEAVGLGIRQAFLLSEKMNLISHAETERVLEHIKNLNLFDFSDLRRLDSYKRIDNIADYLLDNMKKDKKSEHNAYNLVLNEKIGKSIFVKNLKQSLIKEVAIVL